MVSESSIRAYYAIADLEDRQRRVYDVVRKYPGVSSNDVARIAHMDPHNVRCRLTELANARLIISTGEKTDRLTGRTVRQYEARA